MRVATATHMITRESWWSWVRVRTGRFLNRTWRVPDVIAPGWMCRSRMALFLCGIIYRWVRFPAGSRRS